MDKKIICWWSGGITSAVACFLAIMFFGKSRCRVIMIDTHNEDDDTYRFKKDCEKWYGLEIETISAIPEYYNSIEDVWDKYNTLNTANGAICSSELKREVRKRWEREHKGEYDHEVYGFDFKKKEINRALAMHMNYPESKPIFPLLMMGYDKEFCLKMVQDAGIEPPASYREGKQNNNCNKTLCVQGGIGYWQKAKRDEYDKFLAMAKREHKYTDRRGRPVTILKDQSNEAKKRVKETGDKTKAFVFLIKHPDYPDIKCIDDMPPCKVEPLLECNGHCGIDDLNTPNNTYNEINHDVDSQTVLKKPKREGEINYGLFAPASIK